MLEVAALIIGTLTTSIIALAVFLKNRHSEVNRLFVSLAVGLVGWSITTYFSLHTTTDEQTLSWIRWIMFFVIFQNTSFFFLVRVFPAGKLHLFHNKRYIFALLFSAVTALAAVTPLLFADFKDGAPVPGPGMALFIPHALIFAAGSLVTLVIRFFRSHGVKRNHLRYFLAGTLLMYTLEPVNNFIIPVVFKDNQLVSLSPLYSIIFAGLMAYAIVAKRLFDIRTVVARAVAYLLTLAFTFLLFGVLVFFMNQLLFEDLLLTFAQQIVFVLIALITAPSIVLAKKYFDRLTAKVFFQDSYAPEEFFAGLNKRLIKTIDLEEVLGEVAELFTETLKSSSVEFFLTSAGRQLYFRFPDDKRVASAEQVGEIIEYAKEEKSSFIDISEADSQYLAGFERILGHRDTPIFLKLKTQNQNIGFVLVGSKKTGSLYSGSDLKVLQIAGNELALAIQNALRFNEIEHFNITLQESIKKATEELRRTNAKLQALDEAKDEFISMASHQLRTPLTSVKGYLSMLSEGDAGKLNETQSQFVRQSLSSAQRMVYLIADLLNVSRLKTGKFIIEPVETYLPDVVEQEVSQLKETAQVKKVELIYDKPSDFPKLNLDETKLRQVIMNFIDNAIYYTPSGGHIKVELKASTDSVEYTVTDNGIGVPKAEQRHLFTKFYRADNARKTRPDGTGLGLFMAKKVIVASGGALIFRSVEGKGSTFGFSFPIKK